jgi:hypothetical protein
MPPKRKREPLTGEAQEAFARSGFRITEFGNADVGMTQGTCVNCGQSCTRYGPEGSPFCRECLVVRWDNDHGRRIQPI